MPTTRPHVSLFSALLVAIVLASTGCASGQASQPLSTAPIETEAAQPVTDRSPAPMPFLTLECPQLLPVGVGSGLLTEPLPQLEASLGYLVPESYQRPEVFATQQARGLTCTSSNGEPLTVDGLLNPAFVAIQARIIPNAGPEFREFLAVASAGRDTSDPPIICTASIPIYCDLDLLVDDNWVFLRFWGVKPDVIDNSLGRPEQMLEIASTVSDIVANAPRSEESWSPPISTVTLGTSCDLFFTEDRVKTDLDIHVEEEDQVWFGPYEDYESAERAGRTLAPALSCPWHDNSNQLFGGHSTLQGGEWAFRQLEREGDFDEWDDLAINGLHADDQVNYSCSVGVDRCVANAIVGHNWLQFTVLIESNGLDAARATDLLQGFVQTAADVIRA